MAPSSLRTLLTGAVVPVAFVLATFLASAPLSAQQVGGLVAEQGSLTPTADAIVTLFRVAEEEDSEMLPVGTSVTDDDGAFLFVTPEPGKYRVQAEYDGLMSPLSAVLEIGATVGIDDIVLMVPSPLLMMATRCDSEATPGAVVVGTVRDRSSEVPLPGVRVTSRWTEAGTTQFLDTQTDSRGRYLLCGVGTGGFVQFRGEALGRQSEWDEVDIQRPAIVFHDMELTVSSRTTEETELISDLVFAEMAGTMGDLSGRLLDMETGQPISQAVVRIRGTGFQAVSDGEGRFSFTDLQPGRYVIEVQHLGYSVQTSELEVPEGRDVMVSLRLSPRAVELEGIEVTARAAVEQAIRTSPFVREVVSGGDLAMEELRGASTVDVLRTRMNGVQIREVYTEYGWQTCVSSNRRVQRMEGAAPCESVQVILDGARVGGGSEIIRNLPLTDIESMEFIPAAQAGILYGTGGDVANGVLLIYTRGKGPYRSPARDRR